VYSSVWISLIVGFNVELTRWLCAQPTGEAGSLFVVCADFGWEPLDAAAAGNSSKCIYPYVCIYIHDKCIQEFLRLWLSQPERPDLSALAPILDGSHSMRPPQVALRTIYLSICQCLVT